MASALPQPSFLAPTPNPLGWGPGGRGYLSSQKLTIVASYWQCHLINEGDGILGLPLSNLVPCRYLASPCGCTSTRVPARLSLPRDLADVPLERPLDLAVRLAFGDRIALVVRLLAAGDPDFELGQPSLEVEPQRNQRIPFGLHLTG